MTAGCFATTMHLQATGDINSEIGRKSTTLSTSLRPPAALPPRSGPVPVTLTSGTVAQRRTARRACCTPDAPDGSGDRCGASPSHQPALRGRRRPTFSSPLYASLAGRPVRSRHPARDSATAVAMLAIAGMAEPVPRRRACPGSAARTTWHRPGARLGRVRRGRRSVHRQGGADVRARRSLARPSRPQTGTDGHRRARLHHYPILHGSVYFARGAIRRQRRGTSCRDRFGRAAPIPDALDETCISRNQIIRAGDRPEVVRMEWSKSRVSASD